MPRCPEIKLVTEFFMRSYLNTTHLLLHVLSIQMHRFMLDKIQINLLLHILERDVLHSPWLSLSPPHTSLNVRHASLSKPFSGPHFLLHNTVALSGPQGHLQLTDTVSVAYRGKFVFQQLASFLDFIKVTTLWLYRNLCTFLWTLLWTHLK